MTKIFEVNKTYSMKSVCDQNCVWSYKILKRTAKTVWIKVDNEIKSFRVRIWNNQEIIMPLGRYSMAPQLRA